MKFTTIFTFVFYAIGTIAVTKADIVAFSGSTCDGDEGDNVPCDGSCHDFSNRHSLLLLTGGTHCVTYFLDSGCEELVGDAELTEDECTNVNTGTNVVSFICGPNDVCDT